MLRSRIKDIDIAQDDLVNVLRAHGRPEDLREQMKHESTRTPLLAAVHQTLRDAAAGRPPLRPASALRNGATAASARCGMHCAAPLRFMQAESHNEAARCTVTQVYKCCKRVDCLAGL